MANQHQLTLAGAARPRASTSHAGKPPFPDKLYAIMSDEERKPEADKLMKWSPDGESFYVTDPERLGRDVLGKWFKHDNFQSFVRQLNMYGFRKVPQMQAGVLLPSQSEKEVHFEHPYFKRGRPDQMSLIERQASVRKPKGAAGQAPAPAPAALPALPGSDLAGAVPHFPLLALEAPPPTSGPPSPEAARGGSPPHDGGSGGGELASLESVAGGVAAVRRTQAALQADVAALQAQSTQLWAEARSARAQGARHEDMIQRIVRFLKVLALERPAAAGDVHAHVREHSEDPQAVPRAPTPVEPAPRKRQRLMISDGREQTGKGVAQSVETFDHLDVPDFTRAHIRARTPERFATIETPVSTPAANSDIYALSPSPSDADMHLGQDPPPAPASAVANPNSEHPPPRPSSALMRYSPMGTPPNSDALSQLLSSPDQLQRLLHALNNQAPQSHPPSPQLLGASDPSSSLKQQPLSYDPARFDLSQFMNAFPMGGADPPSPAPGGSVTAPGASSSGMQQLLHDGPLLAHDDQLGRAYSAASQLDSDVDALQSSLDGIIASLGMDPALAQAPPPPPRAGAPTGDADGDVPMPLVQPADFDFDAFLSGLPPPDGGADGAYFAPSAPATGAGAGADGPTLGAFLDEIASQAGSDRSLSPVVHTGELPAPAEEPTVGGRERRPKRKSDVARLSPKDVAPELVPSGPAARPRRKK